MADLDYHLAGAFNALFYGSALYGFGSQWRFIRRRRAQAARGELGEAPTAVLSVNIFAVSFFAYFAFYVYGASIEPFNHYIVWTRLPGTLLVQTILFEIARDRTDGATRALFGGSLLCTVAGVLYVAFGPRAIVDEGRLLTQVLLVGVILLLLQGLAHQIVVIRRTGRTGAVSRRMHIATSIKDVSLLTFGLAMGTRTGWPLIVIAASSLVIKAVLIWHFRWVRLSPVAARRRDAGQRLPGSGAPASLADPPPQERSA